MKISEINTERRLRRNLGEVESLAKSIEARGLINPITVSSTGRLISGARRVAAHEYLGRTEIQVMIVDTFDDVLTELLIERDENTERKQMTPSELVAAAELIKPYEEAAAKARRSAATVKGNRTRRGIEPSPAPEYGTGDDKPAGDTRARVADALGVSYQTISRAREVVKAVEEVEPEKRPEVEQVIEAMDSGELPVTTAQRKVREIKSRGKPLSAAKTRDKEIAEQETALKGLIDAMRGVDFLVKRLDTLLISPELAADVHAQIFPFRASLTNFMNKLKGVK
jgi:ParB-like chromosome segregation protein Spo0J